uniref:Uncharacterized protein n=1 Tax=Eutreptiella gymnastica TaxID=73025 RepID=A0A7S4GE99_9EUGL
MTNHFKMLLNCIWDHKTSSPQTGPKQQSEGDGAKTGVRFRKRGCTHRCISLEIDLRKGQKELFQGKGQQQPNTPLKTNLLKAKYSYLKAEERNKFLILNKTSKDSVFQNFT